MIATSFCTTFLLSLFLGYFYIALQFKKKDPIDPLIHFFLAIGLGLGISSFIIFYVLLCFDSVQRIVIFLVHVALLGVLINSFIQSQKSDLKISFNKEYFLKQWPFLILILLMIPIWMTTREHPLGGWDAWQVWNYKARFIFAGGENWKNVFDLTQWRTSPHYPLLLPLINVWHWMLLKTPDPKIPFLTAMVFTFITGGLLYASLKELTNRCVAVLGPLLILTLPFFILISISQYTEIVVAFYLLASLICLSLAQIKMQKGYAKLAGIFIGFLAFTKPEGAVAALLIGVLAFPYFLWADKEQKKLHEQSLTAFVWIAVVAIIPAVLFKFFYSPGNQTMVNGLFSAESPSTLERLRFIFMYFAVELKAEKWNGIWILLCLGLLVSMGRCFYRPIRIFPAFLISYLTIICFYYYLNTYFKIDWWMNVTLHRIVYTLLPTIVFWVFYSVWLRQKNGKKNDEDLDVTTVA